MKLFLLRHTSLNVDNDIFYGQTDLDVSNSFDEEVKRIIDKLIKYNIDLENIRTFSSPLKRCVKLAKRVKETFQIDDRIKEMNLGDWEMKKMNTISQEKKKEWENNLLNFKIPNGESNKEFLDRLRDFLSDILVYNEDLLIVCHAGSINGIISILTNEPFDELVKNYWEKIKHGSLSIIELQNRVVIKKIIGK